MDTPLEISPYSLIQEKLRDKPWQLLVACIMLNQTSAKQAQPVWEKFFERWSLPEDIVTDKAGPEKIIEDMTSMLRPLGFQNRRGHRIRCMTYDYIAYRPDLDISAVNKLYGIGKYAADSFFMFVGGKIVDDVKDKELRKYVEWAKNREK